MTWRRVGNDVAQRPLLPRQSETIEKVIDNGCADDKRILALFSLFAPLSQFLPGIGPRFAGICIQSVLDERTWERFSRTDV